jgi:spore maturation protein CgeB
MEIYPATLRLLKAKGIKMVNFNPDNPFMINNRGGGNKNIGKSIQYYDLHFTYDPDIYNNFKKINHPVQYHYFAHDPMVFNVEEVMKTEVNKLCFIGNADAERAKLIQTIGETTPIDVYGIYWDRFIGTNQKNITIHKGVFGDAYFATLAKYRLQLNMMRKHNPNGHNMRSFEVPGVGGLMLTLATAQQREIFKNFKGVFFYDKVEDIAKIFNQVQAMEYDDVAALRQHNYNQILNEGHTYEQRTQEILAALAQPNYA